MMYGFVTTNVPSFVNYARLFGQVTELPAEVMVATQQRMFARRNVTPRPCDVQLIHAMYELTRHERQLAGEPLAL
jgi:glucose-1-phosphate thymidylyltransferase